MHFVYILYSASCDAFYVGESVNAEERLLQHNQHAFRGASTAKADDWVIKLVFKLKNKKDAFKIEGFIKSMKSRKFIEKLIAQMDFRDEFNVRMKERFSIEILQ